MEAPYEIIRYDIKVYETVNRSSEECETIRNLTLAQVITLRQVFNRLGQRILVKGGSVN